jgi:pimeloyl-ACP methyl ester carboxylesterase
MFVYARQDPMVPPKHGEVIADLVPGARFEWLEDSSHFAHVDSPDRLVPLLVDFLG